MRTYKETVKKELDKIFCDICANDCMKPLAHDNEHANISATWGYDSRKDLTCHNIDLCEDCFDKTILFLKSIRSAKHNGKDPLNGETYDLA